MNALQARFEDDPALGLKEATTGADYVVDGAEFAGKGYTIRVMGEVKTLRESASQFMGGLLLAAILVFLALVAQFRSFLDPFLVLITVPVALAGSVVTLWLSGTPLSIPGFMGAIMVVGIVVEYSILLVEFANVAEGQGMDAYTAAGVAYRKRLRPILMTSLTTFLSLLPMAIGLAGGEANAPLAQVICGGVVAGTLATLFIVPSLYPVIKRGGGSSPETKVAVEEVTA